MAPGRNKLIQFLVLILIYRIDTFCLAQETECKNGACRFKTLLLPAENDQEMKELPVEKAWEICAPSIPFNLTANSFMDCNSAECYFQKKNILKEDGTLNEGALDSYKELPMVNVLKQMCMDTWVPNGLIRKRREERQKRRLLAGTISNSIVDGIPIRHMKNFDSDIWFARHGRSAEEMERQKRRIRVFGTIINSTMNGIPIPFMKNFDSDIWLAMQGIPNMKNFNSDLWLARHGRSAEEMSRRKRELFIGEGENISVDGKTYGKVKNMKIEGGRVTFDNDGQIRKKRTVSYLTGEGNSFNGEALPDGKSFSSDDMYRRYARSADDEILGLAACLDESVEIALSMCAMDKL